MGLCESKESNDKMLNDVAQRNKNKLRDMIINASNDEDLFNLRCSVKSLTEKNNLIQLVEEANIQRYVDKEFIDILEQKDETIVDNMILFLGIVYKNYLIVSEYLKHSLLIIYHFLPSVRDIIDDNIFDMMFNSIKYCGDVYYIISISYYCQKKEYISKVLKQIEKNRFEYHVNDDMFKKLTIDMLKDLNEEFDVCIIVRDKVKSLSMTNEDILKHYKININNQKLNEYLTIQILFGNIQLFDMLQEEGFVLCNESIILVHDDYKRIEIETLDYISSSENFNDFLQVNKHMLMKHCNKDVIKYLKNIY